MTVASSSQTALRDWQQRALDRLAGWDGATPFLVSAAPGAGKTRPALVLARDLLGSRVVRRVVVVCPTTPLTRQWAQAAAGLGLQLAPDAEHLRAPSGFDGVCVTYARAVASAKRWARECTDGTLVIADEAHHLGEDLAWGEGFAVAFRPSRRWLLLSGTPFRSDQSAIPGVRYEDGVCVPDVTYTYAEAVRDGVCRPVSFIPYDGELQWRSGDDVVESSFADALAGREAGRRYRTAISVELPDGLPRILRAAHDRLEALRADGHRDAGGLVVAADASHARAIARVLREIAGEAPTVVLHTDSRAHAKLAAFRDARDRWIVAVNMVSEGVDIPRLRVGVYATAARTPLIFRQIVGRFVRVIAGRPAGEPGFLFLPADPHLRSLAADVETELRHVLRPPDDADPLALDEPLERRATEPAGQLDFQPVAADVAPQLALFGGVPPPPRAAPAFAPAVSPEPASEPDDVQLPAYERRARLRDKRHALVGQLRREDGRSHREINAWLNRATAITRVDDASLDQLQASIDLLLKELDRRSSGRTGRAA
ncbi:MAG: DEAD/DEAH box helicase family protein [Solirubrobacteraceae bacterium]